MKNICEWENCKENGEFKAPLEKDNSRKFRWLCEEHIKLFNKSWNYFEGMEQNEIENFLKSDLTWHRPTQKFGSPDNFFNLSDKNHFADLLNIDGIGDTQISSLKNFFSNKNSIVVLKDLRKILEIIPEKQRSLSGILKRELLIGSIS